MIIRIVHYLATIIAQVLIFLIKGLRPLLGPAECRYELSCGKFSLKQLQEQPLFTALWNIIKRLISCNPISGKLEY